MKDNEFSSNSEDETYADARKYSRRPRTRRRKAKNGRADNIEEAQPSSFVSLQPLLDVIDRHASDHKDIQGDYHSSPLPTLESIMNDLLPEYIQERKRMLDEQVEIDLYGQPVRPLTRSEVSSLIQDLSSKAQQGLLTTPQAVVLRKLKLQRERHIARISDLRISCPRDPVTPLTPLPSPRPSALVNPAVIDALYSIKTTPYRNSFASRLYGMSGGYRTGRYIIAVDWVTRSPWMELMTDIREHHLLAHPERDQARYQLAPIIYGSLVPRHLPQVHDLLARTFWGGIDVTDSLQYSPEKCTVIATYKDLVAGVAIISSPQETYITYLAVKAGWENSQIATSMLYHLIQLNPNKDITLHVSTNSPAMLLYNRFGFKAEEFVAGFYEDYLDPQSRASKNAFRLRLRR